MSILDKIIKDKRAEVEAGRAKWPVEKLQEKIASMPKCRNFSKAVTKVNDRRGLNVIAEVKKASPSVGLIREDFDRAFESVDLVAGPVAPTPAFKIGEKVDDPLSMYLFDLYTISANLAGIGGISIPCGFSKSGLPIGLQPQAPPLAGFEE